MKKVLHFEPSRSFAQFVKYVLSRLGYQVIHVDDAGQILEVIGNIMPDLIIAETNIRDLSGIELCRRLKGDRKCSAIPVAIISVDGTKETHLEADAAGCVDYLTKPVTARAIHELIQRHLPYNHKRQHIRVRMQVDAVVSDGTRSDIMRTATVGEGGMYACTQHPLNIGTLIDISLPLPGLKNPLELTGEVIYAPGESPTGFPRGMGIKFSGMDNNTVTLLRHYMESYLSDYLPEMPPCR
jgi:CheY-like chemotaxis protein/Tfp pilus assembly protein PilZ